MTTPLSRQSHSILYDYYHHQNKFDGSSFVEFEGKKYTVQQLNSSGQFTVERTTETFSTIADFFRTTDQATTLIANTLNNINNHIKFKAENNTPIEGICFSGGGAKGFAYNGIIQELGDKRLKEVTQVSGASAGALTAILVAFGLNTHEIYKTLRNQSTEFDQSIIENSLKKTIYFALNREPYLTYLPKILGEGYSKEMVENITFSQLESLRILSNNITGMSATLKQIFISASLIDKENDLTSEVKCSFNTTPDMPIITAGLASSAIPLIFNPIEVDPKILGLPDDFPVNSKKMVSLRDGGIHNNIPRAYLTTSHNLILSFNNSEGNYNRDIGYSQQIMQWLCGEPTYKYGQADHKIADRYGVHYIDASVSTTQTKKAKENLNYITHKSAKNLDYYLKFETKPITTFDPAYSKVKEAKELNELKYGHSKINNS